MAATTESSSTGLLNLEKELVCFICTEILYQPLTLLDCLHTFCGSCLKEWFSHQHRKALHSHSSAAVAYTCPTCRAPVKDVQHNAMINTLLDMFLAANPAKDRSPEEKAEMTQAYKPGDEILPRIEARRRRESRRREEEEIAARERRVQDDGQRDRSRRERQLHPSSANTRQAPRSTSGSSRSRESRQRLDGSEISERQERHQRQTSADIAVSRPRAGGSSSSADLSSLSPPPSSPRHPDAVEARQRGARTVAHQASLRSLVSASESGTGTGSSLNEAQVMQEILAEGLLDGINVDELTEAEQDELSEIIAERYRQLHPERIRRPPSTWESPDSQGQPATQPEEQTEEADHRPRGSSRSSQRQEAQPSPRRNVVIGGLGQRPPSAFPQTTTEPALTTPQDRAHQRRPSNESSRSEASATRAGRRSATDLSERPQSRSTASERPRGLSNTNRSNTEPRSTPRASEVWQASGRALASPPQIGSPVPQSPRLVMSGVNTAPVPTTMPGSDPTIYAPEPAASSSATVSTRFEEPSISCARCARPNIQYEVHRHCAACNLDLCLRCYRAGRGCNHWFGFGHAAIFRFESSHPQRTSQAIELPHLLIGRQYQAPPPSIELPSVHSALTTSEPKSRLREGNFCDRHTLLPVAHKSTVPEPALRQGGPSTHSGALTLNPYSAVGGAPSPAHSAPSSATSANGAACGVYLDFVPLAITTNCDICSRPISPEEIRYHCPEHPTPSVEKPNQKGDFDLCNTCYLRLAKTGRMERDDGPAGWRLCPNGHRMVAITFEFDSDGGQRRVITRDLVGGAKMTEADMAAWKLARSHLGNTQSSDPATAATGRGQWVWREDTTGTRRATRARTESLPVSAKYPPDGGVGKVCRALWSYYPEDGEEGKGELMFPKHAEVREIEEVNEDWWFGVYAGDTGVFPAVYVREMAPT
ncbi:hypothetical protein LTR99_008077 [Exophiala xenobiotica]|uniref:RING-type domain-containing protein n=1 Tax=Vermiconidia calcicola TaxID=1690605 RepID=A0AAV9QJE8_9PEZI|nr:hypothetical protein LTR96_008474 [Exophiala xenobiotica]KAK5297675.1 hypothetical protein LTR99_008077 [Exophiala xenobiotica]KAK5335331.1 hypothetical protein LTR98_008330 [Exophiala xenobiotica]KAK5543397.1 hypothetical protein LTR25_001010 [Vermiconidia calcicola]KAK5559796.1 hypothetical protein LTR46_001545 [Exophiala xenobiotica]